MRNLHTARSYRQDERRVRRRGKDMSKLDAIVAQLLAGEPLDPRLRPHILVGNMAGCWECHIDPDWLLVWEDDGAAIILMHTGSHADIFGW